MTVEKRHVQHANTKATVVVRTVMTVLFVLYEAVKNFVYEK